MLEWTTGPASVTLPPIGNGGGKLVECVVGRVGSPSPSEDFLSRWKESYYAALGMFSEAEVAVEAVE